MKAFNGNFWFHTAAGILIGIGLGVNGLLGLGLLIAAILLLVGVFANTIDWS